MTIARYRLPLGLALLLALTALWYWPGLAGPFVLDDVQNVRNLELDTADPAAIWYHITHNDSGSLGRGLSMLSFVLTNLLHGDTARDYKLDNLLIHLVNGVLLCLLLLRVLRRLCPQRPATELEWIAGITTAVWLLHPLQVSTVLYVVQRMAQLAALFSLVALLAFLLLQERAAQGDRRGCVRYGLLLFPAALVCAVLSKETGALIPLYALLLVLTGATAGVASDRACRRLQQGVLLLFILLPLAAGAVYFVTHLERFLSYDQRTFTLAQRLLTQVHALAHYLQLIVLPRVSDMSLFKDDFPVEQVLRAQTLVLLAAGAGLLAAAVRLRRQYPVLLFGTGWFVVSHLLESTVLPLELVFEHRNYLASAGILLLLVHAGAVPLRRQPALRWLLLPLVPVLLLQTHARVTEWSNEELLLGMAVQDHPRSARARVGMANYLLDRGEYERAFGHLQVAIEVAPENAGPVLHLLAARCVHGSADAALYDRALQLLGSRPLSVYAFNGLENLLSLISKQQCTLLDLADFERLLEAAVALDERIGQGYIHGYLLRLQGVFLFTTGQYAKGVIAYRLAHEYSGEGRVLEELVRNQLKFGRSDDARENLALLEQQNVRSFGTETFSLRQLRAALAEAERASLRSAETD